jgi:hypothetical protein
MSSLFQSRVIHSRAIHSGAILAGGLLTALAISLPAKADPLYFESATTIFTGGSGGNSSGVETDGTFYSGVNFQVTSPIHVTQIGGLFVTGQTNGNNEIFGAILPVASQSAQPVISNLSSTAVADTLISLPAANDIENVSGAVSVNLSAGWYALIFGSNLFGATSSFASTAESEGNSHLPTTSGGEVTYAIQESNGSEFLQAAGSRYFVDVPEPAAGLLLGGIAAAVLLRRRRSQAR